MKELEIRKKTCPFTRLRAGVNMTKKTICNGCDCAMWEWHDEKQVMEMPEDHIYNEDEGWQIESRIITDGVRKRRLYRYVESATEGDCGLKPKQKLF